MLNDLNSHRRLHSSMSNVKSSAAISTAKQSFYLNKRKSSKFIENLNPDIATVENLEFWDSKWTSELKEIIFKAKEELQRKINHQDIVEEKINKRKSSGNIDSTKEAFKYTKLYEENIMNTYKSIEKNLDDTINKRKAYRKKISDLKAEIKSYHESLEKLNSPLISTVHAIGKDQREIASYLSAKQNYKENLSKQKLEIREHIEMIQIEVSYTSRELESIDDTTSKLRKELRLVKNELLQHYSALLKQGKDTRSEGLSWIIKIMLNLNQDIRRDMFPDCLDDKSIDCILQIAKKSLDLEQCHEKLLESKTHKTTNPRPKPDISARLSKLKKTIRVRRPEYNNKKITWNTSEVLDLDTANSSQILNLDNIKIEEKIKNIKNEIFKLQNEEVKRLTKECLRTGTGIKGMIGYIVGCESVEKFMVVAIREQREIEARKETISTFSFTSKLMPKYKIKAMEN